MPGADMNWDLTLAATTVISRLGWNAKNFAVIPDPTLVLIELEDKIYYIECMKTFDTHKQFVHLGRFGANLQNLLDYFFSYRLKKFDLNKEIKPMFWLLEEPKEPVNAEYKVLGKMALSDNTINPLFGERRKIEVPRNAKGA